QESLETDDLRAAEADLGLIMRDDPIVDESAARCPDHRLLPIHGDFHRGMEAFELAATCRLGSIERDIGRLHHFRSGGAIFVQDAGTDAGAAFEQPTIVEERLAQTGVELFPSPVDVGWPRRRDE